MAKFVIASFVVLFVVSLCSVCNLGLAEDRWCVAKPSTDETALKNHIAFACSNLGKNKKLSCDEAWVKNCTCSTPICKASWAMNAYYQSQAKQDHECYFNNAGLIAITDPSYGKCTY